MAGRPCTTTSPGGPNIRRSGSAGPHQKAPLTPEGCQSPSRAPAPMSAAPDMSKEVSAVFKHKERKPKKPHYIPRPWGKPYNYKCFQCPFTCMEKSHLYNHMKYSLCKNSLSLLIESDWPYKKGNFLALQSGSRLRAEADQVARNEGPKASTEAERDTSENEMSKGEEAQGERQGAPQKATRTESELVITDVYSLEDPVLSARAVEAKLRHYKLPQSCVDGPNVLSEQWRLIATGQRKGNPEPALDAVSMPCYPPPPAYTDCQDPPGLNVSLLGVSYPLSPGLFSYVNPPVTSAVPGHAQLAQLPFLASAAQLLHPNAGTIQHADRAVLPPHFYYPLLCEHALSSIQEPGKESKGAQPLQPTLEPKISLWKVPALKANLPVPAVPPPAWPSRQQEGSYKAAAAAAAAAADEKHPSASKEDRAVSWSHSAVTATVEPGSKRTATPADHLTAPPEKKPAQSSYLQGSASLGAASEKPPLHGSSFRPPVHQLKSSEDGPPGLWRHPLEVYEKTTVPSAPKSAQRPGPDRVLLGDLSRALQEYREADKKIASLVLDDIPGQRYLREHLCKIRSELSHIHQALDKTAKQHEGPLDLSVKRRAEKGAKQQSAKQQSAARDEDEEAEDDEEHEDTGDAFEQFVAGIRPADRPGVPRATLGAVVKTEVVSPGSLGVRPPPGEAVWPSRTTKCEADSSVLLCPDGRSSSSSSSVVFADFSSLRRSAIRDLPGDTAGPPSPLSTD